MKRYVDMFSERIDQIFHEGNPTKGLIIDAFHKSNPLSMWEYDEKIKMNKYQRCVLFIIGYLEIDYRTAIPEDMERINYLARVIERYMAEDDHIINNLTVTMTPYEKTN